MEINTNKMLSDDKSGTFTKDLKQNENDNFSSKCKITEIHDSSDLILGENEDGVKARVKFFQKYLTKEEADDLYDSLAKELDWQQKENFNKNGEKYPEPRLTFWYGKPYKYSTISWGENNDWHSKLESLRKALSTDNELSPDPKREFNSVMCNYYRDNNDSIGWHADDENSLGRCPKIASISLGSTRVFEVCKRVEYFNRMGKEITDRSTFPGCTEMYRYYLGNGSLVLMEGSVQDNWLHRVPKESKEMKGRINLTFRYIVDDEEEKLEIERKRKQKKHFHNENQRNYDDKVYQKPRFPNNMQRNENFNKKGVNNDFYHQEKFQDNYNAKERQNQNNRSNHYQNSGNEPSFNYNSEKVEDNSKRPRKDFVEGRSHYENNVYRIDKYRNSQRGNGSASGYGDNKQSDFEKPKDFSDRKPVKNNEDLIEKVALDDYQRFKKGKKDRANKE